MCAAVVVVMFYDGGSGARHENEWRDIVPFTLREIDMCAYRIIFMCLYLSFGETKVN